MTKIPMLGDIPILGYLFKIRKKSLEKQMLLIVLTPYIINEPGDLRRIFERKMKERREFIETYSVFTNERDFDRVVDYTRKRGALEEINRTAIDAERDAIDLRAAERGLRREVEAGSGGAAGRRCARRPGRRPREPHRRRARPLPPDRGPRLPANPRSPRPRPGRRRPRLAAAT